MSTKGGAAPWVSILTPVANGWEYLGECAKSVFAQTYEDWEWWIGINGHGESGGPAAAAAQAIAHRNPKVHVVNLPMVTNKAEAMNALAAAATGAWVAVLDCDDTWSAEKLLLQKEALAVGGAAEGADVVGTGCWYFGEVVSEGPQGLPSGWLAREVFWRQNPIINSSVLLKKELAHWENRFGLDDYDLWLRLAAEGCRFYNLPWRLTRHRIHAASAFNGKGGQDVAGLLAFHAEAAGKSIPRRHARTQEATSDPVAAVAHPTTVVSAYYPVPSKRPVGEYLAWIRDFWSRTTCPLVFFTDPSCVEAVQELLAARPASLTRVLTVPFLELVAFQRWGADTWMAAVGKDPEPTVGHTAELYALWYEKKEFVLRTIELNPFSSEGFVWCDAGICRYANWYPYVCPTLPLKERVPRGLMLLLQVRPFEVGDEAAAGPPDLGSRVTVGGGVLASDAAGWRRWSVAYDAMMAEFLKRGVFWGKDQNIMAATLLRDPMLAALIRAPQEVLGPIKHWFYLLFFLAGVGVA